MNDLKYVVSRDFLQKVINYINSSYTDEKIMVPISLIDEIRSFKPFDPNTEQVPNIQLLKAKEETK